MAENGSVKVTVSKSGVRSVSPAEIFRSEKGRELIRKTAKTIQVRNERREGGSKSSTER